MTVAPVAPLAAVKPTRWYWVYAELQKETKKVIKKSKKSKQDSSSDVPTTPGPEPQFNKDSATVGDNLGQICLESPLSQEIYVLGGEDSGDPEFDGTAGISFNRSYLGGTEPEHLILTTPASLEELRNLVGVKARWA